MGDNLTVTQGVGTTILADEITIGAVTGKAQIVKIAFGGDGVFQDFMKAGTQTIANSLSVGLASDTALADLRTIGSIKAVEVKNRNDTLITITPTITATPYTANDTVGGKQTIANAYRASGGSSVLQSLVILDNASQGAAFDIIFFNADPTAGIYTDNGAVTWSTDFPKVIGRLAVVTGDYVTIAAKKIAKITNIGLKLKGNATTSLFAVIVTTGTPTYAAGDLNFIFGLDQD